MFTLLSTPCSLPSALSILAVTGPGPRSNTPHFSLIPTAALKWSKAWPPSFLAAPASVVLGLPADPIVAGLAASGGLHKRHTRHGRRAQPRHSLPASLLEGLPATAGLPAFPSCDSPFPISDF
jgi:hypothetical protein